MTYPSIITAEYLRNHREVIFVFGDNLRRCGTGGAASLRHVFNTYGFVTKKEPNNYSTSFYTNEEYITVFILEMQKLKNEIKANPKIQYLISRVGGGLANKHKIFDLIIKPNMKKELNCFSNVTFLW